VTEQVAELVAEQRRGKKIAMDLDALDTTLRTERVVRAATVSADGPHVSPVWFVWDGQVIWLYSLVRSQRWVDLAREPRISVVCDGGTDFAGLWGIEIRGRVEVVGDVPFDGPVSEALAEPVRLWSEKYVPHRGMGFDAKHAWLRLSPTKILSWDFRKLAAPAS
jgi:hypothetical protein